MMIESSQNLWAYVKTAVALQPCKVLLAGDSKTQGAFVGSPGYVPSTFLANVASALGLRSHNFINAGISGATTLDWRQTYVAQHAAAMPTLYIVDFGTNDANQHTASEVDAFGRQALTIFRDSPGCDKYNCSIVLKVTSTMCDDVGGRNEAWIELLEPVVYSWARDFDCAVFNAYRAYPNARDGVGHWLDSAKVHPLDAFNAMIWGSFADGLWGNNLRGISASNIRNVAGSFAVLDADTRPSSYDIGITLCRTGFNGAGIEWPVDGSVFTFKHTDGTAIQMITGYYDSQTRVWARVANLPNDRWTSSVLIT